MKVTSPASKLLGETATRLASIFAATTIRGAGRGAVMDSFEPQPAIAAAATTPSTTSARRPPRGPLQAPDPIASSKSSRRAARLRRIRTEATRPLQPDAGLADGHTAPRLGLAADHRQGKRSEGGGDDGRSDLAKVPAVERDRIAGGNRRLQAEPAEVPVRPALVVQTGDGLLSDVAPLGEAHGAVVDVRLPGGSWPWSSPGRTAGARTPRE